MTVRELVDALLKLPQDTRVLVNGYESGLQDPKPPRLTSVHYGAGGGDYGGAHEECELDDPCKKFIECWYCDDREPPESERKPAVLIER